MNNTPNEVSENKNKITTPGITTEDNNFDKNSGKPRRKKRKEQGDKDDRLERVVQIRRVTKVVKGGKRIGFRATIVVGDKAGNIGVGVGKAIEVPSAIQKGIAKAKKSQIKSVIVDGSIPHRVVGICGASQVLLRPAPAGTGVIAGGAVRTVLELVGIADVVAKSQGSSNVINVAKATVEALRLLQDKDQVEKLRGTTIHIQRKNQFGTVNAVSKVGNVSAKKQYETINTPVKKS